MSDCPAISAYRAIIDIKVDVTPGTDGPGRAVVSWIDRVNQPQSETMHGMSAAEFTTDLHAATFFGEGARLAYLVGRIREIQRQRIRSE